jgi:hypothetical protein
MTKYLERDIVITKVPKYRIAKVKPLKYALLDNRIMVCIKSKAYVNQKVPLSSRLAHF